ncbi:putative pentatricopeptide repeat-containing protein At5g59200, chloroplastic isoform X1 [Asparagus officinalis]|uniref:putative pentatricopeptide repeat-containing protein At5g59200, chloroplastic isoform X1 n=1 Tax=Asparagus officinalis TaxID=4686 RepID=UPI00098E69E6|nr:putative pentatricopeptide repeat-containing protein At5g59200, chloroplastic isoform X1 [Asparagus officinalis]
MSICRRSLLILEKCRNMKQLLQAHAQIITGGLSNDNFALSRILAFCSDPSHGSVSHAQLLFETIKNPTLCIQNTMIKAYLLKGEYIKSIEIYRRMLHDGMYPDNYTLPYILKACINLSDAKIGSMVHTHILKFGFLSDTYVGNTLVLMYMAFGETNFSREIFDRISQRNASTWTLMINGYSKLGEIENARLIFDEAPMKDRGIWGCMISGYVQNNCFKEALSMFRLMQIEGSEPDEGAFVSVLCACAQLGAIDIGTWIHHYLNRVGFKLSIQLATSLIDMYVKCGKLALARKIFNMITQKDTICYNVMIFGVAMHGDGRGALDLFATMQKEGFKPDSSTFLAILTACSHSGLVQEGLNLFNNMRTLYNIEPKGEHYGCIVDFLARAKMFEEAKRTIEQIPRPARSSEKAIAWRSLLSACWNHGEFRLAEIAAHNLMELEAQSGVYVLISNIYENSGRYEDSKRMRKNMKCRGVMKVPGCSAIEICGRVHEFVAGEKLHHCIGEILEVLDVLTDQLAGPNG